ncbi:unnamed protein product [Microthlaspi erraticum]|uniref:Uncharacterized protein n=1 Tax=Microthlaspi erraticum TaxID=1685480 RepID=A0A6D2IVL5_9BRAS|nr:unnamed protein product [Microthlaspi erraticum]
MQRRLAQETEESVEERRLREMHAYVLENLEEERQRDIQRQRREAMLRLEQIKATVVVDEGIRTRVLMGEIGFREPIGWQRAEVQENLQKQRLKNIEEQRKRDIENKEREAEEERRKGIERRRSDSRKRLAQVMKPTVEFDEAIRTREALLELGIKRKEGDGF